LHSFLKDHYDTFHASNGNKAITYLSKQIPDWMMPEKDGIELLTYIKEHPKYQSIPVIIMTARNLVSDQVKAIKFGADYYMIKPIDEDILFSKILVLIESQNRSSGEILNKVVNQISSKDQEWLIQLEDMILPHIGDFNLNISSIAQSMDLSLSQLNRKVKKITGLTTMKYVKDLRFWEARRILEESKLSPSIKIVSFSVGFKDVNNFSRNFKKRFGIYPSEYLGKGYTHGV